MENKQTIGQKIKSRRLELNLRMDDLANQIGISRATLWAIENGNGNYSIDILLKILTAMGLSMTVDAQKVSYDRQRATRVNHALDKKINRFVIMCIEQYALATSADSKTTYRRLNQSGVINELVEDYEDMHGMSTASINEYISSRL